MFFKGNLAQNIAKNTRRLALCSILSCMRFVGLFAKRRLILGLTRRKISLLRHFSENAEKKKKKNEAKDFNKN